MTIQEQVENLSKRLAWADRRIYTITQQSDRKDKAYEKSAKSELTELLQQVAKEQREICAREFTHESEPMLRGHYRILNAPSPLDTEEA